MADPIDIVIRFDTDGTVRLRQAGRSINDISAALSDAANRGERSNRVLNAMTRDLNREFRDLERTSTRALNSMYSGINRVVRIGATLAAVLGGVALFALRDFGRGVRGIGDEFFRINEQFQGLEISIQSVFRSSLVAEQVSRQIENITARSPIPLEDLSNTARGLGVLPQLRRPILQEAAEGKLLQQDNFLGNAVRLVEQLVAFRPDKNAADAVFAIREALSGEFRSLIRRFDIPVQIVTSAAGKSLTELKQDPLGTLEALQKAFDNIVSDRAIENLVRLPSKLFENLVEQIFSIPLKRIGEKGAFKDIQDRLINLFEEGQYFSTRTLDPLAKQFSDTITNLIDEISDVLNVNIEQLLDIFGAGEGDNPGLSRIERIYQGLFNAFDTLAEKLPGFTDKVLQFSRVIIPFLTNFVGGLFNLFTAITQNFERNPLLTTATAGGALLGLSAIKNSAAGFTSGILRRSVEDSINLNAGRGSLLGGFFNSARAGANGNIAGSALVPIGEFSAFGRSQGGITRNLLDVERQAVRARLDQLFTKNKAGTTVLGDNFFDLATDREKQLLGVKEGARRRSILSNATHSRINTLSNALTAAEVSGFAGIGGTAGTASRAATAVSAIGRFVGGIATFGAAILVFQGAVELFKFFSEREKQQDAAGRTQLLESNIDKFAEVEDTILDYAERRRRFEEAAAVESFDPGQTPVGFFRNLVTQGQVSREDLDREKVAERSREIFEELVNERFGGDRRRLITNPGVSIALQGQADFQAEQELQGLSNNQILAEGELNASRYNQFVAQLDRQIKDVNNLRKFLEGNLAEFEPVSFEGKAFSDAEEGSFGFKAANELLDKLIEQISFKSKFFTFFLQKTSDAKLESNLNYADIVGSNDAYRAQSRDALGSAAKLTSRPDQIDFSFTRSFGDANIQAQNLLAREISTDFRETEKFILDLQAQQDPFKSLIEGTGTLQQSVEDIANARDSITQAVAAAYEEQNNELSEASKFQAAARQALDQFRALTPSLPESGASLDSVTKILQESPGRLFFDKGNLESVAKNIFKLYEFQEDAQGALESLAEYLNQQVEIATAQRLVETTKGLAFGFTSKLIPRLQAAETQTDVDVVFDSYVRQLERTKQAVDDPNLEKLNIDPDKLAGLGVTIDAIIEQLDKLRVGFDPFVSGQEALNQEQRLQETGLGVATKIQSALDLILELFPSEEVLAGVDAEGVKTSIADFVRLLKSLSGASAETANFGYKVQGREDALSGTRSLLDQFANLSLRTDARAIGKLTEQYGAYQNIFNTETGGNLPDINFSKIGESQFNALDKLESAQEMLRVLPQISDQFRSIRDSAGQVNPEYAAMADHIDVLIGQYEHLKESIDGGGNAIESFGRGMVDQLETYQAEMTNLAEQGAGLVTDFTGTMGSALGDFITGTKDAKDAWRSFVAELAQSQANAAANKLTQQLVGALTGSLGSLFGGGNTTGIISNQDLGTNFSTSSGYSFDTTSLNRRGGVLRFGGYTEKMPMGGLLEYMPGGGYLEGPSHEEGGIKARTRAGRMLELEGGEVVINKYSSAKYRKELSDINVAGGGVRFEGGGVTSPAAAAGDFGTRIVKAEAPVNIDIKIDGNGASIASNVGQGGAGDIREQSVAMGKQMKAAVEATMQDWMRHDGPIMNLIRANSPR